MAAPSKNFTSIPDTSIDADSPVDTTLMTQIRDSLVHLEEWLGMSYTAAQDHAHNGTDSAPVLAAQIQILSSEKTVASTTYTTVHEAYVYIPSNAVSLQYYLKTALTNGTGNNILAKLVIGATSGGVFSHTSTIYTWSGALTIDISALSGWQKVEVQIKQSAVGSDTSRINTVSSRLI